MALVSRALPPHPEIHSACGPRVGHLSHAKITISSRRNSSTTGHGKPLRTPVRPRPRTAALRHKRPLACLATLSRGPIGVSTLEVTLNNTANAFVDTQANLLTVIPRRPASRLRSSEHRGLRSQASHDQLFPADHRTNQRSNRERR
jgi:hypothetical protein